MLTLAVDTSTRSGSLAVIRESNVLGQAIIPSEQPYGGQFQTSVDLLLAECNIALNQLDLFAVAAGPGSFTGLRIGLTAVKAWGEVFQKPIAPVSVLEAIAAQATVVLDPARAFIVPVLDARRGQFFGALYEVSAGGRGLRLVGQEIVDDGSQVVRLAEQAGDGNLPVFCSPTPEAIESVLRASKLAAAKLERVSPVLAPIIGLLGYRRALRGETVDALKLDASYVRRTDAEMKWKGFAT